MVLQKIFVILTVILISASFTTMSLVEAKTPVDAPDLAKEDKKEKDSKEKEQKKVRVIQGDDLIGYARVLYTTVDDPANHETQLSGVAKLFLPISATEAFGCSGTLLPTRIHVLTAAHCVTDSIGVINLVPGGTATFEGISGTETIGIAGVTVHSSYDGDFIRGNDIAILELSSFATSNIRWYFYATNDNSVGQTLQKIGYGLSGKFRTGEDPVNYPFGTERDGLNKYDAFADVMYQRLGLQPNIHYIPQAIYQYDSDDGRKNHDAFDFFFNILDLGLGNSEVMSSSGDSGGPTFADVNNNGIPDTVVGITSYGITLKFGNGQTSDCTKQFGSPKLDSSCGEFAGDTRVSAYTDFINGVLDSDGDGIFDVNDNCPGISNSTQDDDDNDGIGNLCDALPLEPNKQCVNQTGNWKNSDSWFPSGIPSSIARLVMINCDLSVQDGETVVVGNVLDLDSSSTLILDGDLVVSGEVNMAGTTNVNSNTLIVFGTYNIQSGGIHNNNAAGITDVKIGGNFNVQSGGIVNDSGIHITRAGATSTVSGVWNEQDSLNLIYGTFNVANGGMYNDEAGGATVVISGSNFNVQSGGTTNVNSNTLIVFGTYNVQSGGIHNNNAAGITEIKFGGNFNVQSGGIVNDSGIHITRAGATSTVSGVWNEQDSVNLIYGTLNVANGGVYNDEAGGATVVISGSNFNVQSGGTTNVNSNTLTVFGTYNVQSGGIHNNNAAGITYVKIGGNFNVQSGGIVNDSGIHITRAGATSTVSGVWNEQDSLNLIYGTFNVANGGVYNDEADGATKIISGGNFNLQALGKVNNFGTFEVFSGGTSTLDAIFDNKLSGVVKNFGTINLDCNGMFNDLGTFSGNPIVDICS